MRLQISEKYNKDFVEDTYSLATYMLNMKSTHLFIAANSWDSISIDLLDSIPEGTLRFFHMVTENIKVSLPSDITEKTLRLLTELYPDKAGALRRVFMQGGSVKEVLRDCLV